MFGSIGDNKHRIDEFEGGAGGGIHSQYRQCQYSSGQQNCQLSTESADGTRLLLEE
jgi:hypothetical protein